MLRDNIIFQFYQDHFASPIRMPTVAEIEAFSDRIGVKFPEIYISFIVKHAGHFVGPDYGYLTHRIRSDGSMGPALDDLGTFCHFDRERDTKYSIQCCYEWYNKYCPELFSKKYDTKYIVPFSRYAPICDLAFDFTASRTQPRIVMTSIYGFQPIEDRLILGTVANSLADLFDRMMTLEEFESKYGPNL